MRHKPAKRIHRSHGGGHKSRGFKHRDEGPAVAGHEMTPDQERADRMANRAARMGGDSPFAGGGPMAGPAAAGIGGPQPGPPGQSGPPPAIGGPPGGSQLPEME